jgi:hypothetical protein
VNDERGPTALSVAVQRIVTVDGFIRDVNTDKNTLSLALGETQDAKLVTLPLAESPEITINGMRFLDGQLLKPADLQPGDRVSLRRDVRVMAVDAYRAYQQQGVLRRIAYETRTLDIQIDGETESRLFVLAQECRVTLSGEAAEVTDLRIGDKLELTHDSPGDETPPILTLDAVRPPDKSKWAVLIANQNYDDTTLPPLRHPLNNVRRLRDRLVSRYAVPQDQAIALEDESRIRLEQSLPSLVSRIPADAELCVYVSMHGTTQFTLRPRISP